MTPLAVIAAIYLSVTLLGAAIAFARSRSTLRAFVVALGVATLTWLAAVVWVVAGYEEATAAIAGATPRARVVLDAAPVVPAAIPGEPDRVAQVWQLWAVGRIRVEPEPAFLTALRWLARADPDGTLEWVRRLSPHGASV